MTTFTRRQFLSFSAAMSSTLAYTLSSQQAQAQDQNRYGILGQVAPEISLDYWIDKNGEPTQYSVSEQKGKWVFLKCFQNWCPGCHSSGFPALKKFSDAFADHPDVSIAGIQTVFEGFRSNTQQAVRDLQLRYDLPISMGHDAGDPDGNHRPQTMMKYRTGGTPWIIVIAPDQTVVFNDFHINVDNLISYVAKEVG
ncbi:MAG: redoxin domain-containing protein [Gammaproteobacteria bacterium]|nr:redoxin domain-containing protein [Gammaproteobacteria bacterium]